MKKLISLVSVLAILAIAVFGSIYLHNAEASTQFEEESNIVFRQALDEVLQTEGITAEYIAVTIEPIYDLNLEQMGFMYIMEYYDTQGFAIVINTSGVFEVAEFFMKASNPFDGFYGQKVYVGIMKYLVYYDGYFTDPQTDIILDNEIIELLHEYAVFKGKGEGDFISFSERIYFVNRTAAVHNLAHTTPAYIALNLIAACVPTTGANLIGYWTRFFPSLVPGFVPGRYTLGLYLYHVNPAGAQPIIQELFNRMGTGTEGTNIPQFRSGMTSFVNARGRNISFTSTMNGNNFNFTAAQQQLRNGRPLAIFAMGFSIADIQQGNGVDGVGYWISTGNHAMAGFGYNVITYTLHNGTQRTDRFIRVATGVGARPTAFFNVNFQTQIYQAYAVQIF